MVLLLGGLGAVATVWLIAQGLSHVGPPPFSVVVDGQDISSQFSLAGLDGADRLAADCVALLVAVALVVFVPLMLVALLALLVLVIGGIVLATVGAPLLVVAAVLGLLLSPLIVGVLLLRWLLR
ncbi:MAG: hypothetical protein A3E25_11095 [Burkholderiales bacterium RIFCSPHIGHO2_12_FULL_69_20]|nr:MAG: hypothetical protein A3E25_11095 [Burkholderiales bacterium RIFCSPHIGHO2_12_FULL_69_20]